VAVSARLKPRPDKELQPLLSSSQLERTARPAAEADVAGRVVFRSAEVQLPLLKTGGSHRVQTGDVKREQYGETVDAYCKIVLVMDGVGSRSLALDLNLARAGVKTGPYVRTRQLQPLLLA
jgi:hypothetical protein